MIPLSFPNLDSSLSPVQLLSPPIPHVFPFSSQPNSHSEASYPDSPFTHLILYATLDSFHVGSKSEFTTSDEGFYKSIWSRF